VEKGEVFNLDIQVRRGSVARSLPLNSLKNSTHRALVKKEFFGKVLK
jgi:hypothetical protein